MGPTRHIWIAAAAANRKTAGAASGRAGSQLDVGFKSEEMDLNEKQLRPRRKSRFADGTKGFESGWVAVRARVLCGTHRGF